MTKFAAYDDLSIYAVAGTPEAAIATAREDIHDPIADFKTAKISDELADYIDQYGWNGNLDSFKVDHGTIVRT